jgi:integrase
LADAGVPPRDLQLIMRHSSFTTTQTYYLTSDAAAASKRLASYLYPGKMGTVQDSSAEPNAVS